MKLQFDNLLVPSFIYWFDHKLLDKGEAYTNHTSMFYRNSCKYPSTVAYSSPFKQFVADSSITGANIPSGMYLNGNFIPRGTSGVKIDFENGRFLCNSNVTGSVSGSYAIKDFNVYYTSESEEKLLFNTKYSLNPKTHQELTGLAEGTKTFPAIYIKYEPSENEGFAFGGMDSTNPIFRAIVLSDSSFKLDAACSIFRDTNSTCFGILSATEMPFNIYGDYKSGYNYTTLADKSGLDLAFIEKVKVKKFTEDMNLSVNGSCVGAFIDFNVEILRFPRQ